MLPLIAYDVLKTPLYLFLFSIVKDRSSAEDLTAESFVRLWEKRATIEVGGKIKNFLYLVGFRLAIDFMRSKRARASILAGDTSYEIADIQPDPLHAMIRAEIADSLNISPRTVLNHLSRARKKLAERIKKKGLKSLPLVFIMASIFF